MLVLVCLAALRSPALAQKKADPKEKQAAAHFKQGKAYFSAGAYDKAVEEYLAAYALVPKSALLFNAARAYHLKGDRPKAVEYYNLYLGQEPDGKASDEAREYVAGLTRERAAEAEAARKKIEDEIEQREEEQAEAKRKAEEADKERKRTLASGHVKQAKAYLDANAYDPAVAEYEAAFVLTQDPLHVFDIADATRAKGDKAKAIEHYRRYLGIVPEGPKSDEARKQVAGLTRAIEEEIRAAEKAKAAEKAAATTLPPPGGPGVTGTATGPTLLVPAVLPLPTVAKKRKTGTDWGWVTFSLGMVATGLAADLAPDSAHNGELDNSDLLPVALYVLGTIAMGVGVF
jgi:tetratricopeptide (TPR) repeat protein